MKHLENCDFEKRIKEIEKYSFHIDNGYNDIPKIEFIYCPICGVKLKNE